MTYRSAYPSSSPSLQPLSRSPFMIEEKRHGSLSSLMLVACESSLAGRRAVDSVFSSRGRQADRQTDRDLIEFWKNRRREGVSVSSGGV